MQSKSDDMPSKGNSTSRGRGNFRGCGRGNDNRNHPLRFFKTEINRKSDEIESIYQSKSESPLIADKGDEEGVCYFLRSRLPTAQGTVNGKEVIALKDTGCTGCVVRRGLVSSDRLLGKESDVYIDTLYSNSNVVGVFIVNCRTVVSLTGSHPPPLLATHEVVHPGARLCV